jgi:hypothetical protein
VVNELLRLGIISRPINTLDMDFPIIQYANDTLLILPDDLPQLKALKEALNKFSMSTGLKINFAKSQIIPINVPHDVMKLLADEFGCQIGTMPFTYLGLPLGTTKPQIHDLLPLVCRLERKLTSSSSFLTQGARLQLINSALASMPLRSLCTLSLPPGITKQFDRILRQFLWRDFYGEPKQSLVAWSMVCRPKKCGGLGIVDFQKQNAALLIKFLDKFYNKVDLPWVHLLWSEYYLDSVPHWEKLKGSFWWRDVLKQVDNDRGFTSIKIGIGDTALFWSDNWFLDGCHTPLRDRFPQLFTFVLDEGLSAAQVYNKEDFLSLFFLPLSREAFDEYSQLQ